MHPHPNIHPYKLRAEIMPHHHIVYVYPQSTVFFLTKHEHRSSPTLM